MSDKNAPEKKVYKFEADVSRVLRLVINSLYSNKEIFLRELVSNASDAIDKLRFAALTKPDLVEGGAQLSVRISTDKANKTLTISDNGIGMSEEDLAKNLGTVAHSGTQQFLQELAENKADVSLIGQFGVGFYSAYLVAEEVEVVSRAAGSKTAHRWRSSGEDAFTIEPASRVEQGTDIVLHLKDDCSDYLDEYRIRHLVKRYADYVEHPVELLVIKVTGEGDEQQTEQRWERINEASALWRKSPSDLSDAQYEEFYKHLTHDWEPPLAREHFSVEGTQEFVGLLFIPKKPPFDLFMPDADHGVRLYVKRVFIMDDCDELLPKWLRFVRGVIDSEDLPLNVSREMLQDSRIVRTIRKQVIKRALGMIEKLAEGDDYAAFWKSYGPVLKEGLHFEPEHKDKLAKLVRFESSTQEGWVSLSEYVSRMPKEQEDIYFIQGATRQIVENSPHLEALRARGIEVLFMTDAVDQWALDGLQEFDGKKLVSAMDADLKLDAKSDAPDETEAVEMDELVSKVREVLQDHISEVRLSNRLTDSPVCLVMPSGGLPPYLERLMRLQNHDLPKQKRILELNPNHELVKSLQQLLANEARGDEVRQWIEVLYDQALLVEGSPIEEPAKFAKRLTALLTEVAEQRTAQ